MIRARLKKAVSLFAGIVLSATAYGQRAGAVPILRLEPIRLATPTQTCTRLSPLALPALRCRPSAPLSKATICGGWLLTSAPWRERLEWPQPGIARPEASCFGQRENAGNVI